jgi:hypothetical protein
MGVPVWRDERKNAWGSAEKNDLPVKMPVVACGL